jgi:DNA-binding CsgD family transcriptional regulator
MTAKVTYRQLQAGDELPTGAPRRYGDGRGYIRLRWKIGVRSYVEAYEHRLVAGLPDCHVHHENEDKGDNHPSNLTPLSPGDHLRTHGVRHAAMIAGGAAAPDARYTAKAAMWLRIAELYREGHSTPELGEQFGLDASTVLRGLRAMGVQTRDMAEAAKPRRADIDEQAVAALLAAGGHVKAVARQFGVSPIVVTRIRREHSIAPQRPGRPEVKR